MKKINWSGIYSNIKDYFQKNRKNNEKNVKYHEVYKILNNLPDDTHVKLIYTNGIGIQQSEINARLALDKFNKIFLEKGRFYKTSHEEFSRGKLKETYGTENYNTIEFQFGRMNSSTRPPYWQTDSSMKIDYKTKDETTS